MGWDLVVRSEPAGADADGIQFIRRGIGLPAAWPARVRQLTPSEGMPELIKLARSHRDPVVRKQAMFWLGQSKDPRALTFFEDVLR